MRIAALIIFMTTLLGGCGVKGSLYLPDKMYPQPTTPEKNGTQAPEAASKTTNQQEIQ